jgi:hypothetical protein
MLNYRGSFVQQYFQMKDHEYIDVGTSLLVVVVLILQLLLL